MVQFENTRHEDYLFWLRLASQGCEIKSLDIILGAYREHSNSLTANKIKSAYWHYLVLRKFEVNKFACVFYTVCGRIKLIVSRLKRVFKMRQ